MKPFFLLGRRLALCLMALSLFAEAGVRLPLKTLRDQADTAHCWSYAMSHMLESRALVREDTEFMFDIEQDTKYWVDFDRMWSIYKTKDKEIYLGSYQGGWQIEFFQAMLKHGRPIKKSAITKSEVFYPVMKDFTDHLDFMPGTPFTPDSSLPAIETVRDTLEKGFDSDDKARDFMIDTLNKYYGKAVDKTEWLGDTIALSDVAQNVLGKDFEEIHDVNSLVLVKPIDKAQDEKWVKYLGNRFWGIRQEYSKVFQLIHRSLDNNYPVTFDNGYHAMTILGYEDQGDDHFYAVADSIPGKITWYAEAKLKDNLNMASFFVPAIEGQLPERNNNIDLSKHWDAIDHVLIPPAG